LAVIMVEVHGYRIANGTRHYNEALVLV